MEIRLYVQTTTLLALLFTLSHFLTILVLPCNPLLLFLVPILPIIYRLTFPPNYLEGIDERIPGPPVAYKWNGILGMVNRSHPTQTFYDLSRIYSNPAIPAVRFHIAFGKKAVLVHGPELIRAVLHHPQLQDKPEYGYKTLEPFLGEYSLVHNNGELWKSQRTLVSNVFHMQNMKNSFFDLMKNTASNLLAVIERIEQGKKSENPEIRSKCLSAIDIDSYSRLLGLDIITQSMFSRNYNFVENPNHPFAQAFAAGARDIQKRYYSPYHKIDFISKLKFFSARKYIRSHIANIIQEFKKNIDEDTNNVKSKNKNLIELMLKESMSETMIIDQCITFVFAGHDTTSHTIAWCIYLIATYPEVEKKLLHELDEVTSKANKSELSYEMLGQAKYLHSIIKEVLRLYPPAPMYSKLAKEDLELGELKLKIPKGTRVSINAFSAHYLESNWEEPTQFKPERWESVADDQSTLYKWLPFSLKERNCVGQHFALLEIKVVLFTLYKDWVFRLDRSRGAGVGTVLSLQPANGLWVYLSRRNQQSK